MTPQKINYIVSSYGLIDLGSDEKKFFHSQSCAIEDGLSYKDPNVAEFLDQSKEDIESGWYFVEDRYNNFINIFAKRLNLIFQKEYSNFYDDLIEAKIIHTSPESAAKHLLDVYDNPSDWWHDPSTQMLRKSWLSRNFGEPELLLNYLVSLIH